MDRLTDDERRLLELLAGSANGVSETLLVTRFTLDMTVGLVRERLATATLERTFTAGKPVAVTSSSATSGPVPRSTRRTDEPGGWRRVSRAPRKSRRALGPGGSQAFSDRVGELGSSVSH
jgi:hypothetical protein